MSLRAEIEACYVDAYGLVNPQPVAKDTVDATGNGISYTSVYHWLLMKRGEDRTAMTDARFNMVMRSCEVHDFPGIFNRSPGKRDLNGWDDYTCLATASGINCWNNGFALRIYRQGRSDFWFYNNENPYVRTWKSWFGRNPAFVAHLEYCCGIMPPFWRRVWWAFSIAFSGITDRNDSTSRVLAFLMIESMANVSGIGCLAADIWAWRLRRSHPRGMKDVISTWVSNSVHPLVTYWTGGHDAQNDSNLIGTFANLRVWWKTGAQFWTMFAGLRRSAVRLWKIGSI